MTSRNCYDLDDRLLEHSVAIIRLVDALPDTRVGNHIAGQVLRSGTSALSNHAEAEGAESTRDFVHKLKLCHKELRESRRWLRLIQKVPLIDLNARSIRQMNEMGPAAAAVFDPEAKDPSKPDRTHLSSEGAKKTAALVADEIHLRVKELDGLLLR